MSWLLNAAGDAGSGPGSLELEQRLVAELNKVLSRPEFGAVTSWFRGVHVASSEVHVAAAETDPATPAGEDAAAPKLAGVRGRKAAAEAGA